MSTAASCGHCLDQRLDARAARRQRLVDELLAMGVPGDELVDVTTETMFEARGRIRAQGPR